MAAAESGVARRASRPNPGVAKPDPILVVDGVGRRFGGLTAVDVDHLEVQRGADHRAHRAQRRRQDHVLQPAHRLRQARRGALALRRASSLAGMPGPQGRPRRAWSAPSSSPSRSPGLSVIENMKLGATDQQGERFFAGAGPPAVEGPGGRDRGAGRRPARPVQAWTTCATSSPARCPAASASCSRWPGRSWPSPRWSCSTSRWPA